jgi:hypothetical protein
MKAVEIRKAPMYNALVRLSEILQSGDSLSMSLKLQKAYSGCCCLRVSEYIVRLLT